MACGWPGSDTALFSGIFIPSLTTGSEELASTRPCKGSAQVEFETSTASTGTDGFPTNPGDTGGIPGWPELGPGGLYGLGMPGTGGFGLCMFIGLPLPDGGMGIIDGLRAGGTLITSLSASWLALTRAMSSSKDGWLGMVGRYPPPPEIGRAGIGTPA